MEDTKHRSGSIDLLLTSLAKAQGGYKDLVPNENGPRGMFANLGAIIKATRESCSENGLCLYFFEEQLDEGAGAVMLWIQLGHSSGQYLSSSARVIKAKTERSTGNLLEILKRRHACMLLGIAPTKNDPTSFDDDGEELAEQQLVETLRKPKEPKKAELDRNDTVSKDQYDELMIELDGYEEIAKDIMQVYCIETLADLPRSEYHKARAKILKIKRTAEDYERNRR